MSGTSRSRTGRVRGLVVDGEPAPTHTDRGLGRTIGPTEAGR
ncbi:hypothetical protein ABT063_32675 [Streptomyces sp. NPDC002838]